MGIKNLQFLGFAVFAAVGILICSGNVAVASDCHDDLPDLVIQCGSYVQKTGPTLNPSDECCAVVKSIDIPCVCNFVNPNIEAIIDMKKVVFVANTCGVEVNSGTHCGSYVVP